MVYTEVNGEKIIYLKDILINELPNNFKTPYSLSFEGSSIQELPQNLIVGGNLYLQNSKIKKITSDVIICGSLYLDSNVELEEYVIIGREVIGTEEQKNKRYALDKTMYSANCAYYDNTFVVTKKNYLQVKDENCYFYRNIFKELNDIIVYFGKEEEPKFFICKGLRDGLTQVYIYQIKKRLGDESINYNLDSLIDIPTAAHLYKVCTGACDEGIQDFISKLENKKELYTIAEVIDLTKNVYHKSYIFEQYFEQCSNK
jgi:hypothetical protein